MSSRVLSVAVVFASILGCTAPNPRSCADGACTDPALPFCDVDGAVSGSADTCIAVSCTPNEHASCRGDVAVRCNSDGTNYDLVECPFGCTTTGCLVPVDCMTNADCSNPVPVCEPAAMTCRGCRTDDECASKVCALETGSCLAEAEVAYAAPAGSSTSSCTLAEPCTPDRAITVVTTSATGRTLRLLAGTYMAPVSIQGVVTVNAVATGAVLGTTSGLSVGAGATVSLRGIEVRSSTQNGGTDIVCGDQSSAFPKSSLTIRDSVLAVSSPSSVVRGFRCNLQVQTSEIAALAGGISLNADATFEGDRIYFHAVLAGNASAPVKTSGLRSSARVTNSIIEGMGGVICVGADTLAPGSPFYFAFNTFIFTMQDGGQACDYSTSFSRDIRFENNVFFATSSANVAAGPGWANCGLKNNLLFPQADARVSNTVGDPKFVDAAAKNYHLQLGSPALNTAVPSTGLSTSHDYDGAARPQGVAHDIGAFERTP